jgi:hypothetical protein
MKNIQTIHQLRTITGYALIGSVLTGALLGWIPSPFDLRIIGVTIGALAGVAAATWA